MAADEFLTYEQVLQELQTNRGQLNQFVRSGRLKQHVVSGQTRFKRADVAELRGALEKEPTVMEEWDDDEPIDGETVLLDEGETSILDDEDTSMSEEPETGVLDEDAFVGEETAMLEDSDLGSEPDTVLLEAETEAGDFDVEEAPSASKPSDSALETELDLKIFAGDEDEPGTEDDEDFFDFSGDLEDVEFELEAPPAAPSESSSQELVLDDEDIHTEILDLGGDDGLAEEDLLSEILSIDDEPGQDAGIDSLSDLADITAEITTLEEPTYEESDLDELLEVEDDEDIEEFDEAFAVGADIEVPAGRYVEAPSAVGMGTVMLLILTLIVMAIGALFSVENAVHPDYSTKIAQKLAFFKTK
jgi:hypothetical protein